MRLNRTERNDFRKVSSLLGVSEVQVQKAACSYFDSMREYASSLPLDNRKRIYRKDAFGEFIRVWNIPYLGRLGLSYSRYLQWRRNESKHILQEQRSAYKTRVPRSEIENMARAILSGATPSPLKKKKKSEMFNSIWLVGKEGKKLARQVIPKEIKDV